MEFRDLKKQYQMLKKDIDTEIEKVIADCNFIGGSQVRELEEQLAKYVGTKFCIACANGTDALQITLMAWGIGENDAVFIPDFTFFSSGEVVPLVGGTPIFVDVYKDTYNISIEALEKAIQHVMNEGKLTPKVIVGVDLFGQPADYIKIRLIAEKYNLKILEDGAQGFGGSINGRMACSFGDISTTSFFPAKPLGCYGDGGAIFTDNGEWSNLIRSLCVHGKGSNKYDNVRIGLNSRLDTLQAAILKAKFPAFVKKEISSVNKVAEWYNKELKGYVETPFIREGFISSWAQYTIKLKDKEQRDTLQQHLKEAGIPSMIYYLKPMHRQLAFGLQTGKEQFANTEWLCDRVLSLPLHPYMGWDEVKIVSDEIKKFIIK